MKTFDIHVMYHTEDGKHVHSEIKISQDEYLSLVDETQRTASIGMSLRPLIDKVMELGLRHDKENPVPAVPIAKNEGVFE